MQCAWASKFEVTNFAYDTISTGNRQKLLFFQQPKMIGLQQTDYIQYIYKNPQHENGYLLGNTFAQLNPWLKGGEKVYQIFRGPHEEVNKVLKNCKNSCTYPPRK
jgi:hypothetical protein